MSFRFAMAGIAFLSTLVAGAAHASYVYSLDAGTISGPFNLATDAVSLGSTPLFYGAWVTDKTGTSQYTSYSKTSFTAPTGIAFAYTFDFKLGANFFAGATKPAAVNFQLDGNPNGTPMTADFYLKDLRTGLTVSTTKTMAGTTDLALSALIPKGNTDAYALILLIPQRIAQLGANNFTISGSVPVPGSLLMLGAFLLGLVGLSYGNNARRGW